MGVWIKELSATQATDVTALAHRARLADGVDPLNEDARLSLRGADAASHLLTTVDGELVGYLNWNRDFGTGQLVVDPLHRRRGIATRLWAELNPGPGQGCWAFANLTAAQGFAAAIGLEPLRGLLMMQRPLADIAPAVIPPEIAIREFREADIPELLAVNAAAFAHHPEQGALDAAGFAERMAERWFDPAGLLIAADAAGIVGFHWTKATDAEAGEVYVVAVAPRAQGNGYGKVLLQAGLSHLASKGLTTVSLYVDSTDEIAVRMYEHAGFSEARRDVFYASKFQEQR